MIRKTSKRRGTSVIAALIALCAVVGYGLTEWAPLDNEPQAVPARQREERQTVREKVEIPDKGEPVRLLTMNAGNYFVPEDPRRSNFQVNTSLWKPVKPWRSWFANRGRKSWGCVKWAGRLPFVTCKCG